MNTIAIPADNTTADCNTEINICYDAVNKKTTVIADYTSTSLNTEANISYDVVIGNTALTPEQGGEGIYQEIEHI